MCTFLGSISDERRESLTPEHFKMVCNFTTEKRKGAPFPASRAPESSCPFRSSESPINRYKNGSVTAYCVASDFLLSQQGAQLQRKQLKAVASILSTSSSSLRELLSYVLSYWCCTALNGRCTKACSISLPLCRCELAGAMFVGPSERLQGMPLSHCHFTVVRWQV